MRYAVYMGHGADAWEVWVEDHESVKLEKMSGHATSDEAHAAHKRYRAANVLTAAKALTSQP
jgi:hypothetical protein